jgi:DNA invertase Pin-like site-specific DNA recombinase
VRIVAYVRVSSARQEESFGPEVQRSAIRKWSSANGHQVIAWQSDAITGTSELASREGWREAAALVKRGKACGVVVARLDRLARDVMVQEYLLRNLSDFGGVLFSARESENELLNGESKDPSRKLIRTILGAVSEYDREMVSDRLSAARHAKAAGGGYAHGALPYGYRSQGGKLVPVAAEQKALAKMRLLAGQGVPNREIARVLTAEGYPTKRGGQWCAATVGRIIKRANQKGTAA